MTADAKKLIDKLFTKSKHDETSNTYRITLLKNFSHSNKVSKIRKNLETFDVINEVFVAVQPVLSALQLSVEAIKHYATSVDKKEVFELARKKDEERYLVVVCFVAHQYYRLQDHFVDTLYSVVKSAVNKAERDAKEKLFELRNQQSSNVLTMADDTDDLLEKFDKLKAVLLEPDLTDAEKIALLTKIIVSVTGTTESMHQNVDTVREDQNKLSGVALVFSFLSSAASSIENKCSGIVQRLVLKEHCIDNQLAEAVSAYKAIFGKLTSDFPCEFLSKSEYRHIFTDEGFKSGLCKVLLYKHIIEALRADGLHLQYSYRFIMLEDYFVPKSFFDQNFDELISDHSMEDFVDPDVVLDNLALEVNRLFEQVNERVLASDNPYIKLNENYEITTTRYKTNNTVALSELASELDLIPPDESVSIAEVLSVVDDRTHFLDHFQHYSGKENAKRPNRKTMIAAILSAGCHFSFDRFSRLCETSINSSSLSTALKNYLSTENARLATDSVISFVDKMPLSAIYQDNDKLYTSSDGIKYNVSEESMNAHGSFKYGGNRKITIPYLFVDSRMMYFNSKVINPKYREAHFVLDAHLNNSVVKTDMHCTDQHGYTEVLFGMGFMFGINLCPRIPNVLRSHLYSFKPKKTYRDKSYAILPSARINKDLIREYWREFLRMIVSIRMGKATASQVLLRLNSYSEKNHPMYKAAREFGRILKTIHVLNYIDDVDLRAKITKQLNKGESGNKLDRALAVGSSDINVSSTEEQEIMFSCKELIKNCISCWNYMYYSDRLLKQPTLELKVAYAELIKRSSPSAWRHIIIHGVFDFSEPKLRDSKRINFNRLQDPTIQPLVENAK